MEPEPQIVEIVRRHFPSVQAIYLFGSFGTGGERPDSDVDIALLFHPTCNVTNAALALSTCRLELEDALRRDVDLLSARELSTVFQKEVVYTGQRIACSDENATVEFEFMTLSLYQKLNEERKEILENFARTGRAYHV